MFFSRGSLSKDGYFGVCQTFVMSELYYDTINWEANITIQILPCISWSQGNQAIKFGQLIEYIMRNIFLKNYINNAGGEASPTPFQKIKIEHIISLDYQSVMLHSVFLLYVLVEVYQNIFKLQCWPLTCFYVP